METKKTRKKKTRMKKTRKKKTRKKKTIKKKVERVKRELERRPTGVSLVDGKRQNASPTLWNGLWTARHGNTTNHILARMKANGGLSGGRRTTKCESNIMERIVDSTSRKHHRSHTS